MKKLVRENLNEQYYQKSGYAITLNFQNMKEGLQALADKVGVKIVMDVTPGILRNKILWTIYGSHENVKAFIDVYAKFIND